MVFAIEAGNLYCIILRVFVLVSLLAEIGHVEEPKEEKSHPIFCTEPTLKDLSNDIIVPLKSKWREIGIQLGVSPDELDVYYDVRNRNIPLCFTDVLEKWRKSDQLPYTWATILEILESPFIGESAVASAIKNKLIAKAEK